MAIPCGFEDKNIAADAAFLIEFKMPSMLVFVPHQINQIQVCPGRYKLTVFPDKRQNWKRIERAFTRNGGRLDMIGIAVDADLRFACARPA